MKKFWRVVLIFVLVAIILGVVGLLAGMLTGADIDRIFSVFDEQYSIKVYYQYALDVIRAITSALF